MNLDGLFNRPEVASNLLVDPSSHAMCKLFACSWSQGCNLSLDRSQFGVNLARLGILLFGSRYSPEQVLLAHRLGQEINSARPHGAHTRWDVALSRDEDDRPMKPFGCQRMLQRNAVETWHGDVQQGAPGNHRIVLCEEFLSRRVRPGIVPLRA